MDRGEIDPSWMGDQKPTEVVPVSATNYIPKDTDTVISSTVKLRSNLVWKVVVAFISLAIILLTLFLLSEAGYLTLGVEHWWGLSNRPEQAITEISEAIGQSKNWHLDGEITMDFAQPDVNKQVQSSRLIIEFAQDKTDQGLIIRSQWIVKDPQGLEATVLGPNLNLGKPVKMDLMIIGGDTYIRLIDNQAWNRCLTNRQSEDNREQKCLDNFNWTKFNTDEFKTLGLSINNWSGWYSLIGQHLLSAKRIRGKTINSRKSKGYQFVIDSKNLASQIVGGVSVINWQTQLNHWVDSRNKLPYLLDFRDTLTTSNFKIDTQARFLFSNYQRQSLLVTIPSAEQAKIQTLIDWLSEQGIINVDSVLARDAKRKADLTKISIALEDLAAASKPFSYPNTNNETVRLDQDDEIKKMLQPYLDYVPVDPLTPNRYYGYKSDGQSFRLSAVLENNNDTTAKKEGDFYLYLIKSRQSN